MTLGLGLFLQKLIFENAKFTGEGLGTPVGETSLFRRLTSTRRGTTEVRDSRYRPRSSGSPTSCSTSAGALPGVG